MLFRVVKVHSLQRCRILFLFRNHGPVIMTQETKKKELLISEVDKATGELVAYYLSSAPENSMIKMLALLSQETKDKIMNILRPDI